MKIYITYIDKDKYIEEHCIMDSIDGYNPIVNDIKKGISTKDITRRIGLMALSQSPNIVDIFDNINYKKILDIYHDPSNDNVKYIIKE